MQKALSILRVIIVRKRSKEKGLILNFMNRNLFSCVRFLTRSLKCVACLHRCIGTGKFVFATDSKYAVCFDEKTMEKVFRRFCEFIIGRGRTVAFFLLCRVIFCPTNMSRHLRHGSLGGRTCGT